MNHLRELDVDALAALAELWTGSPDFAEMLLDEHELETWRESAMRLRAYLGGREWFRLRLMQAVEIVVARQKS